MARSYQELIKDLNFNLYPAAKKKFRHRVFIVHFFGGNQRKLLRHIRLLNQLGLDVYAIDLSYRKNLVYKKIPKLKNEAFKVRSIWSQEIKEALDYIPGPVITYGFSGPSACLIEVAVQNKKVEGLISDSGPFTHLLQCNYNLAKVEFGLNKTWLRALSCLLMSPLWDLKHTEKLLKDLSNLPKGTPYLSFQPMLDKVVPVDYMQDVFTRSKHELNLSVCKIKQAGHLEGLKKDPENYRKALQSWLENNFA